MNDASKDFQASEEGWWTEETLEDNGNVEAVHV